MGLYLADCRIYIKKRGEKWIIRKTNSKKKENKKETCRECEEHGGQFISC